MDNLPSNASSSVHESHPTPLVWLTHSASVSIVAEVVRAGALETGGLLVGYWSGEADVVVTDATRPGPLAAHAEDTYVPDADHDELAMARLYAASGRRHAYLGDWHSHPRGGVGLSERDRRTLLTIATSAQARAPVPLMGIVVPSPSALTIAFWRLCPQTTRRVELCRAHSPVSDRR